MNCLKYHENAKTKHFYGNIFEKGTIQYNTIQLSKEKLREGVVKIKKRVFNKRNTTSVEEQLPLLHWRHIDFNGTVNEIYDMFFRRLTDIYDANFPIRKYILKDKDIKSPWISKGLKKSSKKKRRLCIKFLRLRHLMMNLSAKPTKIYSKN